MRFAPVFGFRFDRNSARARARGPASRRAGDQRGNHGLHFGAATAALRRSERTQVRALTPARKLRGFGRRPAAAAARALAGALLARARRHSECDARPPATMVKVANFRNRT